MDRNRGIIVNFFCFFERREFFSSGRPAFAGAGVLPAGAENGDGLIDSFLT